MAVAALLVLLSLVAPQIAADRLAPDVSIAEQDIQFSNDFPKAL